MQKIIYLFLITLLLFGCGAEDLREANLRILTLKKQLPPFLKYKENEEKYMQAIQEPTMDSLLRKYITPKEKFFDTFQIIKLTVFQPFSDRYFIFSINRQDFALSSTTKIINFLELTKKLGNLPSGPIIADTSNKVVKKMEFRKLMNDLSGLTLMNANSDLEDDPGGHFSRYNYELEYLSVDKEHNHKYINIKKHHYDNSPELKEFLRQFFQIVDLSKLEKMEKLMLQRKLLEYTN